MSAVAAKNEDTLHADLIAIELDPIERRICNQLFAHFGQYRMKERLIAAASGAAPAPQGADVQVDQAIARCRGKLAAIGLRIEATASAMRMVRGPRLGAALLAAPGPGAAPVASADTTDTGIEVGKADNGRAISLDLEKLFEGRLLIQGSSGAGKSWTLRRLLEQTAAEVQQIVLDPEGDFVTLAPRFGHTVVNAGQFSMPALSSLAARIREHRVSTIFDLSDMDRELQRQAVTAIFSSLLEAPREHWHPAIVAVDEAHLFAPHGGQGAAAVRRASIEAVTDLMSRGRKRGLCGILATQRLARLAKSVVSEAQNFLIGLNTLDLDIRRAAETIGWDARRAFDRLPTLQPGDFVAVGNAFRLAPATLRVGAVETEHRGSAPSIAAPAALPADQAEQLLDIDALIQASAAEHEIREQNEQAPFVRISRQILRDPNFALIAAVWEALKPLAPMGARVQDLAAHLRAGETALAAALAFLDQVGAIELDEIDGEKSVRVERQML